MRQLFTFLLFIVGGIGLGFFSAAATINGGLSPFQSRNGVWSAWPAAGNARADPYTKAHYASTGELPLIASEVLSLHANTDETGETLYGECIYAMTGGDIDARLWTVTAYDEAGALIENPAKRSSFNSDNVLREPDGSFDIVFSSRAMPGNWIPLGRSRRFFILLRLYNAESAVLENFKAANLPTLSRIRCN